MRIKSQWPEKGREKTIKDHAGALAFIAWRIAKNMVVSMEEEGFNMGSVIQRLTMMEEVVIYLTHISDRLIYDSFDHADRHEFITEMVKALARTLQSSGEEVAGSDDYKKPFIEKLNQEMAIYSGYDFVEKTPSLSMLRYLGDNIVTALQPEDQRWYQDQIIEIEAPDALATLTRGMKDLLSIGE